MKVFVVIPSYNEASSVLRGVVASVLDHGYEAVVVDDGSSVAAQPCLESLGSRVHCLRHAVNLGQGAALQTGMDYALSHGAEAVIHFDGDGQHDVEEISQFVAALSAGADVALGTRFQRSSSVSAVPVCRRCLLRLARVVNWLFTGLWLTDAHNGFRGLNRHALSCIDLRENRMAHATEIVAQIRRHGLRYVEVPVTVRYTDYSRRKGQSWANSLNILIDLILNKLM